MRKVDGVTWSVINATPAVFRLEGGEYAFGATATFGGGSLVIQKLHADGSTYLSVHTALTAEGFITFKAPAGTYRLLIATATAVTAFIERIPGE